MSKKHHSQKRRIKKATKKTRNKRKPKLIDYSKLSWNKLSSRLKVGRTRSSKAIGKMRRIKMSLKQAAFEVGIKSETVKKHFRPILHKQKDGTWVVDESDNIEREKKIFENGEIKTIVVSNSEDAFTIAQYFVDIEKSVKEKHDRHLEKYKVTEIRDIRGKLHRLETTWQKVFDLRGAIEKSDYGEVWGT